MNILDFTATREDGATYKGLAFTNFRTLPPTQPDVPHDKIKVWAGEQQYTVRTQLKIDRRE